MRDGRPNPDIWGNIITCGEIAVGIYEIVGSKKRGLEIPKAVAEEILPESVMEQATQDGEALCFTDPVSNAIVADALLEQELVIDPRPQHNWRLSGSLMMCPMTPALSRPSAM